MLIKVLSGAYQADGGEIFINGENATIRNPRDARDYNTETICQTLALADNSDAAANLFLGRELVTSLGMADGVAMQSETRKIMGRLNPSFEKFGSPISGLSISTPVSFSWMNRPPPLVRRKPNWCNN